VDPEVVDNQELSRFEIRLDGRTAGFAAYRATPGRLVFTHTEIDESFEGQGLGSRLAAGALDAVRGRSLGVVPQCPFIAAYIKRHPGYADLITTA
jgi:predicted GNAT family acetyltransferase